MHTRRASLLLGLLAFPTTSLARDVVWTQTWADELPLTVAEAYRVPGGIAVKTLDGALVAVPTDPVRPPIAAAPPRTSLMQERSVGGIDGEGNLLLSDSDLNFSKTVFFRPGQWSHELGPGISRIAEGCARVLQRGSTFRSFDESGRLRKFDRSGLNVSGFVSQPACSAWGGTPSGSGLLVRIDDGAQTPLSAVPIAWLSSWGTREQPGYAYVGRDPTNQIDYRFRTTAGTEWRVSANGTLLGSCFAEAAGNLPIRWAVLEQQTSGRRLRGFADGDLKWELPLDSQSTLVNCRIHQKTGEVHQYRNLDLVSGMIGPAMPVQWNGQNCTVPEPDVGLAVCGSNAHRFSFGNSAIHVGEALRYASISNRGYWLSPESSQSIVGFRISEQNGRLHGQLERRSTSTGELQGTSAERDLGIAYDPTVRYSPQLLRPLGADRWLVTLNRSRESLSLPRLPLVFSENGAPIVLRDSGGAPAEISSITVSSSGRITAVRSNPDQLLEWSQLDQPASMTTLGTSPGLSGIAGNLTIITDFAGSARRLRALAAGDQQWSRPINSNCRSATRGDTSIYLLCATTNQPPRTFYTVIRINAADGNPIWERVVVDPDPQVNTFGNYVLVRNGELQILGSGRFQMMPGSSFARLRVEDGTILSISTSTGDFAIAEIPDLTDGLAAETGLGLGFEHRLLRGHVTDGLQSHPIVEPDVRLHALLSDASSRWFTIGQTYGRVTLQGRFRPPALIDGAVGVALEPTETNAPDGFQDYRVQLTGDTNGNFGRIGIRLLEDITNVDHDCGDAQVRHGTPTRIDVSTPLSSCVLRVRVATYPQLSGNIDGFHNVSSLTAEIEQPYRFHARPTSAVTGVRSGFRSSFEPF